MLVCIADFSGQLFELNRPSFGSYVFLLYFVGHERLKVSPNAFLRTPIIGFSSSVVPMLPLGVPVSLALIT